MMKKVFVLLLLFFAVSCFSQQATEKYNQYLKRYEHFDSNGNLTGYKTYNPYLKQWEYFEEENTQSQYNKVQSSYNFPLIEQVLETKNKRYDDNVKRVQHVVNDIMSTDVNEFKVRFSNSYINKLNNRTVRYDPSSNDSTDSIIIWLYQGASLIWRQLTDENK